jgi:hypothetical protein
MVLLGTWASDRFKQRGVFVAGWALIGAIGYLVQATVATPGVRYFATEVGEPFHPTNHWTIWQFPRNSGIQPLLAKVDM